MSVTYPNENLIPGLRNLWKKAFGDTDEFLDLFFSTAYAPGRCRCIADGEEVSPGVLKIRKMVEKPSPEDAPSRLAFAARYIFTPEIFAALAATGRGKNNEIQLTDAMQKLLLTGSMYGCRVAGKRYDIGSKSGFLKSTVEFGLRRPEFREEFLAFLRETVAKFES